MEPGSLDRAVAATHTEGPVRGEPHLPAVPEPHLRAADTDRAAVAAALGEYMSAGRLTLAEYDDRVARAYAARTFGDPAELTADLPSAAPSRPATAPATAPAPTPRPSSGPMYGPGLRRHHGWGGRNASWQSWLTTSLIVVTIWLATSISSGTLIYFWPIWVIGPWGAVLLTGGNGGPRDDRDHHGQLHA